MDEKFPKLPSTLKIFCLRQNSVQLFSIESRVRIQDALTKSFLEIVEQYFS